MTASTVQTYLPNKEHIFYIHTYFFGKMHQHTSMKCSNIKTVIWTRILPCKCHFFPFEICRIRWLSKQLSAKTDASLSEPGNEELTILQGFFSISWMLTDSRHLLQTATIIHYTGGAWSFSETQAHKNHPPNQRHLGSALLTLPQRCFTTASHSPIYFNTNGCFCHARHCPPHWEGNGV